MDALVNAFLMLVDFIANQVMAVIWAIQAIPNFAVYFVSFFSYCPSFLVLFLEVSLALMLLFAVLKLR